MALDSMQEIFDKIQAGRKPFWQVVRDTDVEERQVTAEASFEKMHATWRAMVESVDTYRADRRSVSGLVGGDAQRMWDYAAQQETLCGPYLQEVIATALCVAESNACMHRIVAAPTAGACGVLPAAGRAAGDRSGWSRRHTIRTEREGKAGRAPLPGTGAVRTKEGPALRQVLLFAKGKIRRSGWPGLSGTSPCRLQSGRPKSSPHSRRRS